MTKDIEFFVPGQPVGKGRPRIGRVNGNARMFTPEKTVNYEGLVKYAAHEAMNGNQLIDGPVGVTLWIGCQIPASWSLKKQKRAIDGLEFPTTKPDIDNLEKAIFDAMNGVVWKDDVQVISVAKWKKYSQTPGVKVAVTALAKEAEV